MSVIKEIQQQEQVFTAIRRDIHAHPEVAYEEVRTSDLVAKLLEQWHIKVHRGFGKTGLVGVLHGAKGAGQKTIGIRADMDALPMPEYNRFAHVSTIPGRMHGCGHDGHTTILLAAAHYLSEHRDFAGTVNFIFQPAEEGFAGAKAMMDDGLFDKFPCDEIYGLHNLPGVPTGKLAFVKGAAMASSNTFEITIKGVGGHAAMPHKTVDPIVIASEVVGALQTVISRHKNPDAGGVLSVTQFHAGDAFNVIPDEARLSGTVRTFDDKVLDDIENNMRRIVETLPQMHGGSGVLDFRRIYPTLVNWDAPLAFAMEVAGNTFGKDHVIPDFQRLSGSEDFAFFLQKVPGAYLWLGNGDGSHREAQYEGIGPCELHNPNYDFNDTLLPVGATYWVRLVEAFFRRA